MSTLFVTAGWPHPVAEFRHGMSSRMRLWLRALQGLGPLDMLIYTPWNQDAPPADTAEVIREDMGQHWGVHLRSVRLAPSRAVPNAHGQLVRGYLLPMLHLGLQPDYARLRGTAQRQALHAAVQATAPSRVFVHRLPTMQAWWGSGVHSVPAVLDLDDVEHRAFERALALPPHWGTKRLRRLWLPAMRRGEHQALRAVARAFVCSETDRQYLQQRWGLGNVQAIANALPDPGMLPPAPPTPPAPATVLFVGSLTYAPNQVGAAFLATEVWPLVLQRLPQARLWVAGAGAEGVPGHGSHHPSVRFLGFVQDLEPVYRQAHVVCAPIFSGGGTRVKIIESALYGRPVVSTPLGAEGLALSPAAGEIAFAQTAQEFATQILRLIGAPEAAAEMARRARQAAQGRYVEEAVLGTIRDALRTVGRQSPPPPAG